MAVRKAAAKAEAAPEKSEIDEDSGVRVNIVSRDRDGNSLEAPGFRLLVQEGASDANKAAAWNLGGEMPSEDLIVYIAKPQV
jgi:hypothetical protein